MGLLTNIKRAVNNVTKEVKKDVNKTAEQIRKIEQKAENKIRKAIPKIEDKLKKGFKGLGGNLAGVAGYAPLLPYFVAMKMILKKKGIKYDNNIVSVANQFSRYIVRSASNYETFESFDENFEDSYDANTKYYGGVDIPVYPQATYVYNNFDNCYDSYAFDLQYNVDGDATPMAPGYNEVSAQQMEAYKVQAMQTENPAAAQGFDPNNIIGKTIGGAIGSIGGNLAGQAVASAASGGTAGPIGGTAGGAVGGAMGGAVAGGIEGIVKGIIKWFKALIKAKKEGKNLGDLEKAATEATNELAKTTAEEAAAMEATLHANEVGGTGTEEIIEAAKNNALPIIIGVVVLAVVVMFVKKK